MIFKQLEGVFCSELRLSCGTSSEDVYKFQLLFRLLEARTITIMILNPFDGWILNCDTHPRPRNSLETTSYYSSIL